MELTITLIKDALTNPVLLSAICGWTASQLVKLILLLATGQKLEQLGTGGGMPSSHTATVTGLLFGTILSCGTHGFEFPMALFFAIIVIFDALRVRFEAGRHGRLLNHLKENLSKDDPFYTEFEDFRESLGHTVPEVIVGAIVGTAAAILLYNLVPGLY